MAREEFRFWHRLRVRWAEADMQGIVFNGHYLTYFDVAFTEYWRATGLEGPLLQAQSGFEMFARKSTIEYHAPARFDDQLDIGVRLERVGNSSLCFRIEIHREDPASQDIMHLVSGELVYVYAHVASRSAAPVPEHWRRILTGFESAAQQT
jgi:acyl-CoA thioester hydrolase